MTLYFSNVLFVNYDISANVKQLPLACLLCPLWQTVADRMLHSDLYLTVVCLYFSVIGIFGLCLVYTNRAHLFSKQTARHFSSILLLIDWLPDSC